MIEYKTVEARDGIYCAVEIAKQQARDGWELVCIEQYKERKSRVEDYIIRVCIFKRNTRSE